MRKLVGIAALGAAMALAGCGGGDPEAQRPEFVDAERETIFDLFINTDDPNTQVAVNRYIWNAALEVLSFMPIETSDPFSGVLVFGFGRPPGGGPAYRGTVYVRDPALDARSLNVALATSGGPVSATTQRAIEDAILTRARQLRVASGEF